MSKPVQEITIISSDLKRDILIGAGTMQKWDISIKNEKGHTHIYVSQDMRDSDINEVI